MKYKIGDILYYKKTKSFKVKVISETHVEIIDPTGGVGWHIGDKMSISNQFALLEQEINSNEVLELLDKLETKLNNS